MRSRACSFKWHMFILYYYNNEDDNWGDACENVRSRIHILLLYWDCHDCATCLIRPYVSYEERFLWLKHDELVSHKRLEKYSLVLFIVFSWNCPSWYKSFSVKHQNRPRRTNATTYESKWQWLIGIAFLLSWSVLWNTALLPTSVKKNSTKK
jgi:hypothetical protein